MQLLQKLTRRNDDFQADVSQRSFVCIVSSIRTGVFTNEQIKRLLKHAAPPGLKAILIIQSSTNISPCRRLT